MSTLTSSSRFNSTARANSAGRASAAVPFSSAGKTSSLQRDPRNELNSVSGAPQFSATPRFRVLMAMEPAGISGEEESAPRFLGNRLPDFQFREGMGSLTHHWEKLGFAINFIAIVAAIAYVMLT